MSKPSAEALRPVSGWRAGKIDSQHRHFFELLDQVESAAKASPEGHFPVLVEALQRYASYHFASEEALMQYYRYPSDAHRREHAELASSVQSMTQDPNFRVSSLSLFMHNWLVRHIQVEDLALAKFVRLKRSEQAGAVADALEANHRVAPIEGS